MPLSQPKQRTSSQGFLPVCPKAPISFWIFWEAGSKSELEVKNIEEIFLKGKRESRNTEPWDGSVSLIPVQGGRRGGEIWYEEPQPEVQLEQSVTQAMGESQSKDFLLVESYVGQGSRTPAKALARTYLAQAWPWHKCGGSWKWGRSADCIPSIRSSGESWAAHSHGCGKTTRRNRFGCHSNSKLSLVRLCHSKR